MFLINRGLRVVRKLDTWIIGFRVWSLKLEVMSILVRHAEKGLMMVRDVVFKLNVEFIIRVSDEDRK